MISMKPFASVFNLKLMSSAMPRFLSIGVFCFMALAASDKAAAYTCAPQNQKPQPIWVGSFGQNADAKVIFGYAQTRPQAGRALVDIAQLLKSRALSDLALNIRSNVSSKISSELSITSNAARDAERNVTMIESAAESNLSLNAVSDSQIYIDEQACMIFARVSLQRADLPYIVALSDFQQFTARLDFATASMDSLSQFRAFLGDLNSAVAGATNLVRAQHSALKGDIDRTENLARNREIEVMTAQLPNLTGAPKERQKFARRLLSLVQANGDEVSPAQAQSKKQAEQILSQIDALMGSAQIAVGWQTGNAALNEALEAFFATRQEKYWRAAQATDLEKLSDIKQAYDLKNSLFIEATSKTTRKFGIDEAEIIIELTYSAEKTPPNTKQMKTKAIGRPINDKAIADKIITTLALEL
jgi:hypothetical protein